jgi:hypothetical protein
MSSVPTFAGNSTAESELETTHFSIGALILGRRMADLGIGLWGDEPSFHAVLESGFGSAHSRIDHAVRAALAETQSYS